MWRKSVSVFLLAITAAGCDNPGVPGSSISYSAGPTPPAERYAQTAPVRQQPYAGVRPAGAPAAALPPGSVRVQRADIVDRNGFERPMVASTVFVPAGWKTQGGVIWNPQNTCGPGYNVDFHAVSPDGATGVHFFPMERWEWNSMGGAAMPGCPVMQITSIGQYLQNLVQRARPGARILDSRPRPDIAKKFQSLNQTTPMPMGESRAWVEAGEVLIAYSQNGVDMRETISCAVMFNVMIMYPMSGMPGSEYLSAATFPGFAMRAPNGQLDFRVAEMIRKSAKPNPEWTARIAQHNAKITSINVKGARDRARITAQAGEEIRQMQSDSWKKYNESFDRMSRESSEAIRGVETYNDPYHGGSVQLDNTYDYAWQLNDGTYVLTDDVDFNPFRVLGQDGQQLKPLP